MTIRRHSDHETDDNHLTLLEEIALRNQQGDNDGQITAAVKALARERYGKNVRFENR